MAILNKILEYRGYVIVCRPTSSPLQPWQWCIEFSVHSNCFFNQNQTELALSAGEWISWERALKFYSVFVTYLVT